MGLLLRTPIIHQRTGKTVYASITFCLFQSTSKLRPLENQVNHLRNYVQIECIELKTIIDFTTLCNNAQIKLGFTGALVVVALSKSPE